ncbi:Hypothetical protein CINCED_3A022471 [Cinara cedri]|uniref:Uncharacterized protein n=1 Tax=Cinara cedri TaxID=506608 RepID=A0A5E4NF50_9HEMI|nr:Hypothetical protein CINCED_3A022471 [Cinara cedri]
MEDQECNPYWDMERKSSDKEVWTFLKTLKKKGHCRILLEQYVKFLTNCIPLYTRTEIGIPKVILDTLKETEIFYPSVFLAIYIRLSTPATAFTAERRFSTS